MKEERAVPCEGEEKALDSTSALEKVLRLDRKHTNFDYHDSLRNCSLRIAYPQLLPEGPSSETLLKSLWRHVANYYFKRLEEGELERLRYLQTVLSSPNEGTLRFTASQEFWTTLSLIFSQEYLQRYLRSPHDRLDYLNWLELLHIVWQTSSHPDPKEQRRLSNEHVALRRRIAALYDSPQTKWPLLQQESLLLAPHLDSPQPQDDELSQEIRSLEEELSKVQDSVEDIFQRLTTKAEHEITLQQVYYCDDQPIDFSKMSENESMSRRLAKAENFQAQTQYIEYAVRQLERKQIAESITKLQRVEKVKGQIRVLLVFEEAMGIKPQLVTEAEFLELNALREYSLLKFYNTASKSKFAFVCQNYLGFKDIHDNRTRPCKLRNKDIYEQMKRSLPEPQNAPFYREFAHMQICHHCKLLHPESALVRCDYRSGRCGNPIPPSPYYDSYIYQVLKNQQSRSSAIRFLNSSPTRRNSYFHYLKKEDQFVCERRYCRYCLKNYEDSREKMGGLCPYCRGVCYCTRCARNDMMVRLKSMYILLGGDINHLQGQSLFEQYYQNGEDAMGLRRKDKSGKVSRRPPSAPARLNDKMLGIRYQLQDLRIICDLVKRREKNKQKLFINQKETFRSKIQLICPDFAYLHLERQEGTSQEPRQDTKISDKLTKKLKRMIS